MGFPAGPLSDAPPSLEGGGVKLSAGGPAPGPVLALTTFVRVQAALAPNNEVQLVPLASSPGGSRMVIKNIDSANDLIVNPAGGTEFIDGLVTPITIPAGESRTFTSDLGVSQGMLLIPASWWTQGT